MKVVETTTSHSYFSEIIIDKGPILFIEISA
jgi:hypothetical protein